ncbi:MAG: nucleotide sugar dehydrogenase [Halobacteriota archaeon]
MSSTTESVDPLDALSDPQSVSDAFERGDLPVAVYGLGKMGLPLAAVFADVCGNVIGADIDNGVVDAVNAGESHVSGEPGLSELVASTVASGSLRAVTDLPAAAAQASVHVILVPTLITDRGVPDLSIVDDVVESIAPSVAEGDLVVVESTVPPTTCVDRVVPGIESESRSDRSAFGVAFCPERTKSGRAIRDIRGSWPKIVGGVDEAASVAAATIYESITENEVIRVSDATTAEAVKVFEGVHRDVNIALANELARYTDALEINVREAITAANTQDECDILRPGPGVGGHCIPYYPYFLFEQFDVYSPLLETARKVNDDMPSYVVGSVVDRLDTAVSEATILVVGLTYRPGVAEIRASPAIDITRTFETLGATVFVVDPLLDSYAAFGGTPIEIESAYDRRVDAIVVVTPHEAFDAIEWDRFDPTTIVDTHGTLDVDVAALGHRYHPIAGQAVDPDELRDRWRPTGVIDGS